MNTIGGEIVIFGCGGHSRSVADVLLAKKPNASIVFVDKNARDGERIYGFDVYREYVLGEEPVFIAIGDNEARKRILEKIQDRNLFSIISGTAQVSDRSTIAPGCFVGNFCHVGPQSVIGRNTILNTAAVIEHEVTIGENSHIGPNATISGRCKIGDLVFVGVGATTKDYVTICSNVIVGAGAVVVKDIAEPGIYVGCPAIRLR